MHNNHSRRTNLYLLQVVTAFLRHSKETEFSPVLRKCVGIYEATAQFTVNLGLK